MPRYESSSEQLSLCGSVHKMSVGFNQSIGASSLCLLLFMANFRAIQAVL